MTFDSTRHVHTLRLRAPDSDRVQTGVTLVRDALHTATLPEGSRVLIVRSLDVGQIDPRRSSAAVALAIEAQMREISAAAVYAREPAAERAQAVYFHDAIEPSIALALKLAHSQPATEWFWSLALPRIATDAPPEQIWRQLVFNLAQHEMGAIAVGLFVEALLEADALESLLRALRPADGTRLLAVLGWAEPPPLLVRVNRPLPIPNRWRAVLKRWLPIWGADSRALWLVGAALAAERPPVLFTKDFSSRVMAAIERMIAPAAAREDGFRVPSPLSEKPVIHSESVEEIEPPLEPSPEPLEISPIPVLPAETVMVEPAVSVDQEIPGEARRIAPAWGTLEPTDFAGIYLLLPLMLRLGMGTLLADDPDWIDLDVPIRLLRAAAGRVGVPEADPTLRVLPRVGEASGTITFVAPAHWLQLAQAGVWQIRRGEPNVLYDASGHLALALWHGAIPDNVRDRFGDNALVETKADLRSNGLSIFLDSWLTAMRRWARRIAQIGLYDLIHRPGAIAATRTHIDVLFDGRMVDLRIRRSGLDFDPHWLPWLGRVVEFHYVYDDEENEW